jgi:hypothetical protein
MTYKPMTNNARAMLDMASCAILLSLLLLRHRHLVCDIPNCIKCSTQQSRMVIDVVCMLEINEIVPFTPRVLFIQGNMYPIQMPCRR